MVTIIRAYTTSFCDLYSKHISVLRHFQYYVITHFAYMLVPRSDALLMVMLNMLVPRSDALLLVMLNICSVQL